MHMRNPSPTRSTTRTAGSSPGDSSPLQDGALVGGRYAIQNVLGAGGMSTVYTASDTLLDRRVALKILRAGADEIHAERFRREVLVGQEGHPNLVTTYDAGIWDGRLFIAMELIRGRSLRALIAAEGPMADDRLERLVDDLLEGLAQLHDKGITHRDLKSSNVMITEDEMAKIADFGLARMPEDHTVTMSQESVGTPAYMAPEQILGKEVGPPADLYALGVLLYEAATGSLPFSGESHAALIHQQLKTPVKAGGLESLRPQTRNLILRLLEKDPSRRYPDARACLKAWQGERIRKPLPRRALAIGVALLLVTLVFIGFRLLSAEAIRTIQEASLVRGINRFGIPVWTKEAPGGTEVIAVPKTAVTPPGFLLAWQNDTHDAMSSHIALLDRKGRTIFDFQPATDSRLLRSHGFSGSLVRFRLLPAADVDGDGDPDLLAILYGAPWYFSAVVELQPEASRVGIRPIILNPGIIEWVRYADADHDGTPEWYVAAMDNELLHTACVYRIDHTMLSWPPPRLGSEPAFPSLRWFNLIPREGGASFRSIHLVDGGGLQILMQDGRKILLDSRGNRQGIENEDSAELSRNRLQRWTRLSAIHLLLLDHDLQGARKLLAAFEPDPDAGDHEIENAYQLLLEARLALESGEYGKADEYAMRSHDAAPISDDALMLSVTARILDHRLDEVSELIAPDSTLTMGSPADFQEIRGLLDWLQGQETQAWQLFEERGRLPPGLAAQDRARLLIGQGNFKAALEAINTDAAHAFSRERLGLLSAIALEHLGRSGEARKALSTELDRHPWLKAETGVISASLAAKEGSMTAAGLGRAVDSASAEASRNLYSFLDLPLLLVEAADASRKLGDPGRAGQYLDQADKAHPGLALVREARKALAARTGNSQRRSTTTP